MTPSTPAPSLPADPARGVALLLGGAMLAAGVALLFEILATFPAFA